MQRIQYAFAGLDLGQRNDYSAIAILDLVETIGQRRHPVTFEFDRSIHFQLRGLHRFPLGTAYTEIPGLVRSAIVTPPIGHFGPPPQTTLAIDAGGPGIPVIELLRQAQLGCNIMPATITGGATSARLPGGLYSVPRKELVSTLRLSLERRLLVFPLDLPLRNELEAELANFESAGGQSKHDDMAIALALALWSATRRQPALFQEKAA